jgi:hypothetical protein
VPGLPSLPGAGAADYLVPRTVTFAMLDSSCGEARKHAERRVGAWLIAASAVRVAHADYPPMGVLSHQVLSSLGVVRTLGCGPPVGETSQCLPGRREGSSRAVRRVPCQRLEDGPGGLLHLASQGRVRGAWAVMAVAGAR